jgi:hypothetical protein
VDALRQIDEWGAEHAAAVAAAPGGELARHGDAEHVFRWASVTKLVTALAALVAAEEGTLDLDEPAGPPGATVCHLLAHASGLPFDGSRPIARPGERRIYSNTGFEALAEHLAGRAEMPFAEYLEGAVLEPLGMHAELRGSAAAHLWGTLEDLVRLAGELLEPTLFATHLFRGRTVLELFEVRRMLEPEAAAMAALRADPDILESLRRELDRMHAAGDRPDDLVEADAAFHDVIGRAPGNAVLRTLLQSLSTRTVRARLWYGMTDRGALDLARAEHTRIYEAIAAGDADLARAATLLHIAQNERWLREHLGPAEDVPLSDGL